MSYQPGSVWLAKRPGSRSANRIVQRQILGARGRIIYSTSSGRRWCSQSAWDRWVKQQGAVFSHVSEEHVLIEEHVQ